MLVGRSDKGGLSILDGPEGPRATSDRCPSSSEFLRVPLQFPDCSQDPGSSPKLPRVPQSFHEFLQSYRELPKVPGSFRSVVVAPQFLRASLKSPELSRVPLSFLEPPRVSGASEGSNSVGSRYPALAPLKSNPKSDKNITQMFAA